MKKPLPNPPLIREGSKDAASASCPSPDKGRPGGVSFSEKSNFQGATVLNWKSTQLGKICRLINGRAYKKNELLDHAKYPVLRVGNFFTNRSWYYSDLELDDNKYCDDGDLLYAWSASFGPRIWDGGKVIYHYHIWKVETDPTRVDKQFLYYWFYWDIDQIKEAQGTGTTMIHVTKGSMESRPILLPPLPEQIRIANKLDSLLAKVETAQTRLEKIPALLKRFRQAVLAAATSGELTEVLPSESAKIGDVCEVIGGLTKNAKRATFTNKLPYLRVANVYENEFRLDDVAEIGVLDKELERVLLLDGDLLLVEGNGSLDQIGRVALWDARISPCVHQNHLIKIRVNKEKLLPQYLLYYLMSPTGKKEIVSKATSGAGLYTLSLSKISSINVDLFDLNEQAEIVRRVESLFAMADTVGKQYQAAKARLDKLTQSILAKAFRGELVPQDPDDEPASELLQRIQAERASPKPGSKIHAEN